ncbi:zinc ribbon domain-containing protein [Lactobacillaceae bacterium Scapto_B20]
MNKKCPNCGREADVNAKFCSHCGYNFEDSSQPTRTERRQHIYDSAINNDDQDDHVNHDGDLNQNQNQNKNQKPPHKKHNKLVITLLIIIALLVIGVGVAAYQFVLTPGDQNSVSSSSSSSHRNDHDSSDSNMTSSSDDSTSSSSASSDTTSSASSSVQETVSADDTNSIMGDVFSTAADSINGGDDVDDVSDDFVNEESNPSYQNLLNWVNAQKQNSDINSVDISVQGLTTTGNQAKFQVKYVFHQPDGQQDHVQIFNWNAKMEKDNDGDLKIASMTSDTTAASDYDE